MTKDRNLELPAISSLTTNRKFRDAVAETLKKWPKGLKGDVWDAMVQRMLEEIETIGPGHPDHPPHPLPPTTEETLETQEWVDAYLRLEHAPNIDEADTSRKPFTDDGVPHVILRHFEMWLSDEFKGAPSRKAIQSRLRGCLQSLELVLNLMNEPQIVPQRPDGRTVGDPRPPTPTSQTRRPTPYSGPAGGSERHPVFASERMPLADGPARSASLADPVQVLPQLDHGWNVGTSQ